MKKVTFTPFELAQYLIEKPVDTRLHKSDSEKAPFFFKTKDSRLVWCWNTYDYCQGWTSPICFDFESVDVYVQSEWYEDIPENGVIVWRGEHLHIAKSYTDHDGLLLSNYGYVDPSIVTPLKHDEIKKFLIGDV